MPDAYRIAKRAVEAEVTLAGQPTQALRLFLSGQAETHAGVERPSDLVNGTSRFLPAIDGRGVVHFLQRESIVVLAVGAEHEFGDRGEGEPDGPAPVFTKTAIYVTLETGSTLPGVVEYLMPEGQGRLQDYLNLADRFLVMRRDGQVLLINKRHIVRVDVAVAETGR